MWSIILNSFKWPDWQNETQFLPSSGCVDTAVWMHYMDANETAREKAWWQLHKNAARNIEQVLEATPDKAAAIRPPTTHHKNVVSNIEQVLAATPHKAPTIRPPASHHENYPN